MQRLKKTFLQRLLSKGGYDVYHTKLTLGHKSVKSTETYIHCEAMIYEAQANDQFIVKVADTLDDAIKTMEVGFEYHAEIEGHKLFRKRK